MHIFALFFIILFSSFSFSQSQNIDPALIQNLSPEQKILVNQYLANSNQSTTITQPKIEKKSTKDEKEATPTVNNKIRVMNNWSPIEKIFNNIDSDHDLLLKPGTILLDKDQDLEQVGYDLLAINKNSNNISGVGDLNANVAIPKNYRLSQGDKLTSFTYGKKEEVLNLTVNSDGDVFFPSIGPIKISGLTLSEATKN